MPKKLDTAPLYRRIIADAWYIALHHKQLWIFGFFATLTGFGGVLEVFFSSYNRAASTVPGGSLVTLLPGYDLLVALHDYFNHPMLAAVFGLLVLLLAAVFTWMAMVSVGALIADTRKISRGGEPSFADGVKAGSESFWPVLGVNLLVQAVVMLAVLLIGANLHLLLADGSYASGFMYVGSYVVFTLIAFVASLVAVFGSIGVVVDKEKPMAAIESSLKIIRKHWLVLLETSVLLVIVGLGIGAVAALAVLILSVPLVFMVAVSSAMGATSAIYGFIALTASLLILGAATLGSFLTAFTAAAWTLLWNELADRSPAGIVHRAIARVKAKLRKR